MLLIGLVSLLIIILFLALLLILLAIRSALAALRIALVVSVLGTLWLIHRLVLVPVGAVLLIVCVSCRVTVGVVASIGCIVAALLLVLKVLASLRLMSLFGSCIRAAAARLISPSSASHV